MEKTISMFFAALCCTSLLLLASACSKEEENMPVYLVPTRNPDTSFLKGEKLRILDIGNSYTLDATALLREVVAASGIDVSNVCLYTFLRSSGSFSTWCNCYEDKDTVTYYRNRCVGGLDVGLSDALGKEGDGSVFREALTAVQWDLIVIHQVSSAAPYKSLWTGSDKNGCLDELLTIIRRHQPQAKIGFYLVHSTWGGYDYNEQHSSFLRWQLIANSVRELEEEGKIDLVIPYGTAIENLRGTSLNNAYDLTRDGLHLSFGLGQYAAACCYYEAVFAPRSGVSVVGNTTRVDCSGMESLYPAISVNDENAAVAQTAALQAVQSPYTCQIP